MDASRHHRSSPSDRFLGIFSSPPGTLATASGGAEVELHEDEVLWTGPDFSGPITPRSASEASPRAGAMFSPSASASPSPSRSFRGLTEKNYGILAALPEEEKKQTVRNPAFFQRNSATISSASASPASSSSSSRLIPVIPRPKHVEYSMSMPGGKIHHHSLPVNVPVVPRRHIRGPVEEPDQEDDDDEEKLPPHEMVARKDSPMTTFSVLEGVGRTLKGRDLRQVRNAVWRQTGMSGEASVRDREQWFFFCRMQEREARGGRPTRTTPSGYWKATGSPTPVFHGNRIIGVRKTMVFYQGRAPTGRKTSWKMNEYRAAAHDEGEPATTSASSPKPASSSYNYADIRLRSEFSLCRVYKRSGDLRSFDRRPVVMVMNDNHRSSAVGDDGVGVSIAPPLGGTFPRPPEILGDAACVGGDYQMDGTVPGWELAALREEHAAVDSAGVDDDGAFDEEHWDRFLAGSDRSDAVTDGGGEDAIDPIHLVLN